jgi:hypothetical protein
MLRNLVNDNDLSIAASQKQPFDTNKAKSSQILILFSKLALKYSKNVDLLTFMRLLDGCLNLLKTDDKTLNSKIMSNIQHLMHILINTENQKHFSQYLSANGQMMGHLFYFISRPDVDAGQDVDTFIKSFIKSNSQQLNYMAQSNEYKRVLKKFVGDDSELQSFLFTFFDIIPKSVASLPKAQAKLLFDYLLRLVSCYFESIFLTL